MVKTEKVIINIINGCAELIEAPKHLNILIKDYDVQGVDETVLKKDKEGDLYQELILQDGFENINPNTEKFARKCDHCSKVFNEGYCIGGGEAYYCSKDCLLQNMTEQEFGELYDDGNGDSYWTAWEDEDDFQYYADGTKVEE